MTRLVLQTETVTASLPVSTSLPSNEIMGFIVGGLNAVKSRADAGDCMVENAPINAGWRSPNGDLNRDADAVDGPCDPGPTGDNCPTSRAGGGGLPGVGPATPNTIGPATGPMPTTQTPWYKSCTAEAFGSGVLSAGVDALGFVPGEKDVQAAVQTGSGTIARRVGNWNGYRGVVADQFGARFIAGQSQNVAHAGAAYSISNTAGNGDWLGTGLAVAGLIPGLNDVAAALSIAKDIYQTATAIAECH